MRIFCSLLLMIFLFACKKDSNNNINPEPTPTPTPSPTPLYFPTIGSSTWQMMSPDSLGWNSALINDLYGYLDSKNTKAFIVLKDGKMVMEKYFGTFTADSFWYWASAGKTATAMLTGIAQHDGFLRIEQKTSDYLGRGWTSLPLIKENLISIRHQLTMTTGLDDAVPDDDCTTSSCLQYKADAGTRWAYHNAPYTLLDSVLQRATGLSLNLYFKQKIRDKTGMNGLWIRNGYNNVYYSNARSMARFGLLMLNKGIWDNTVVLPDSAYFLAQTNTSQNINLSYGYLTWLNGKASHMLPTLQTLFSGSMIPNAPADLYAALGKNDQKIYVVPSMRVVVIRMGNAAGNIQLALSSFDNELWGKLKLIMGY